MFYKWNPIHEENCTDRLKWMEKNTRERSTVGLENEDVQKQLLLQRYIYYS